MATESVIIEISIDDKPALAASARLEKSLATLKQERKELLKATKNGTEANEEQAKEIARLNIQIGETSKKLRTTRKDVVATSGSLQEMRNTLAKAKTALARLNPQDAGFEEARKKVAALNEEVTQIEESFGQAQRRVGQYRTEIIKAFDDVGISLGGITDKLPVLGTGPLALAAIFAGATVSVANYLSNLEEVRKETALLTGASGELLNKLTGQAQALSDVFGQDAQESIKSAQAVSQAFGISLDQSLNLIGQGLALGGSELDGYTDLLQEFSGVASEAGLSGEQFISFLEGASQSGEFVFDRLPDLLKDASINLRDLSDEQVQVINNLGLNGEQLRKEINEGSKTTFDAIQEVSGAIGELDPKTKAVADGLVLLGSQAEDLGAAQVATLANIDTNLNAVIDSSNEYEKQQLELIKAQEELRVVTSAVFSESAGLFGKFKADLQIISSRILVGIIKGFINLRNGIVDVYNNSVLVRAVANGIGLSFKNGFEVARLALSQLLDGIATGGKVIGAILTGNFREVGTIYSNFLTETRDNFTTFGKNTAENYADAFESTLRGRIEKVSLNFDAGQAVNNTSATSSTSAGTSTSSTGSASPGEEEEGILPRLFRINVEKFQAESDAANEIADANLEKLKERIGEAIDAKEEEVEVFETAEEAKRVAQDASIDAIRAGTDLLLKSKDRESKAYKIGFIAQRGAALAESLLNFNSAKADIFKTATKIEATLGLAGIPVAAIYRIASFAGLAAQKASIIQDIASVKFAKGGLVDPGGPSHAQGGIHGFVRATQTPINFEGGEYFFSKNAVSRIGVPTLNAMNFGGMIPQFFQDGGIVGPLPLPSFVNQGFTPESVPRSISMDVEKMEAAFSRALVNMKPQVLSLTQLEAAQNTMAEINDGATI